MLSAYFRPSPSNNTLQRVRDSQWRSLRRLAQSQLACSGQHGVYVNPWT